MSNFSANSPTEEIKSFLESLMTGAKKGIQTLTDLQRQDFYYAKHKTSEDVSDPDFLLERMHNNGYIISYGLSSFEQWENSFWLYKIITPKPADDTKYYRLRKEHDAIEMIMPVFDTNLKDMKEPEDYFRIKHTGHISRMYSYSSTTDYVAVAEETLIELMDEYLPENFEQKVYNLKELKGNLEIIQNMYDSLTTHEYETVTLEEGILNVIDSIQKALK